MGLRRVAFAFAITRRADERFFCGVVGVKIAAINSLAWLPVAHSYAAYRGAALRGAVRCDAAQRRVPRTLGLIRTCAAPCACMHLVYGTLAWYVGLVRQVLQNRENCRCIRLLHQAVLYAVVFPHCCLGFFNLFFLQNRLLKMFLFVWNFFEIYLWNCEGILIKTILF